MNHFFTYHEHLSSMCIFLLMVLAFKKKNRNDEVNFFFRFHLRSLKRILYLCRCIIYVRWRAEFGFFSSTLQIVFIKKIKKKGRKMLLQVFVNSIATRICIFVLFLRTFFMVLLFHRSKQISKDYLINMDDENIIFWGNKL